MNKHFKQETVQNCATFDKFTQNWSRTLETLCLWTVLFTDNFSHLHYNVIQRGGEAENR